MPRRQTTPDEQAAIDLLTQRGYKVVRLSTYEKLRTDLAIATHTQDFLLREASLSREWAEQTLADLRKSQKRLNEVINVSASEGVSVDKINKILGSR